MTITTNWTAVRDWASGELLTADNMDTYVSSNLNFLKTPPIGVQAVSTTSTGSATFVAVTGVTQTVTSWAGGRALIWFSGTVSNTTLAATSNFDFGIDGTLQGDATNGLTYVQQHVANHNQHIAFMYVSAALATGSHTFTLRWKTGTGTLTLQTAGQFGAREI